MNQHQVFVTGGTGYIGKRLIPVLLGRGHKVAALARKGSEQKLPDGCVKIVGNALEKSTFAAGIAPADTFIHLIGVAHPGPGKAQQFQEIDLVSVREAVAAAREAGVKHVVYLSVVQAQSIMKEYVQVRAEGERMIRESGMNATFIRPWYVLGPGHRWPYLLLPLYWISGLIPALRMKARQFGLVTLEQMMQTLVDSVEHPPRGIRVVEVEEIRKGKP